jgi:hypothetical protein
MIPQRFVSPGWNSSIVPHHDGLLPFSNNGVALPTCYITKKFHFDTQILFFLMIFLQLAMFRSTKTWVFSVTMYAYYVPKIPPYLFAVFLPSIS